MSTSEYTVVQLRYARVAAESHEEAVQVAIGAEDETWQSMAVHAFAAGDPAPSVTLSPMFEKFKSLMGTFRNVRLFTKHGQTVYGQVDSVDGRSVTLCPRGEQNAKTVPFENIEVIEVLP